MRLLREDEEFRLAVMGLLGIVDIQSSLRQLVSAVNDLIRTVQRLVEGQERLWDGQNKLWEENRKMWEAIKALQEGQNALRTDVNRLWENQNKLWETVKALQEGQNALRADVNKLWEENKKINENIEKLWQENNKMWKEIRSIRIELSGVSRTVGALVERDVRHYLPSWVRERFGVNVDRLRRARIEGIGEFDGYAEVDNKVVAVEIKATLRLRDVEDFVDKVSRLRSAKVGREVIAVVAYANETRDTGKAVELARTNGIKVVKHHGEDDFEELT
ncbi:hypothetical protein GCM10007112_01330 [Vulcanisaeta souniana JCM 11219]|uniref:PaREP7 n=1 Tax=Vulcanisaeta souniana JCM 11219 TaxID=1293586 RepID=A0A830DY48_9CREN|nr:hypothetical protein GCM10007112_01330 [Vulcanisaeta souniana JCM 11219]